MNQQAEKASAAGHNVLTKVEDAFREVNSNLTNAGTATKEFIDAHPYFSLFAVGLIGMATGLVIRGGKVKSC